MNFNTYPFEKLNELLRDIEPNDKYEPLSLTIGEPQFETPKFICDEFTKRADLLNKYAKTSGEDFLKESMKGFVKRRFGVELKSEEIIPSFGTREVLFNFPQFLLYDKQNPVMAYTNPFYQIYEGAAIASRAKSIYINLTKENDFKPILDKNSIKDADLVILNFPNNPTASSMSIEEYKPWIEAALEYDFVLLNDECYSEIYFDNPPPSLLEASLEVGNGDFKNVLVINSISKRSSAPGLRSGFIAGDSAILKEYAKYRTYTGCAVSLPLQYAAAKAWEDDEHVEINRQKYRKNFQIAKDFLGIEPPEATFYIWLEVDNDIEFTKKLYKEKNLKVIPGTFLSRDSQGKNSVRIAFVHEEKKTKEAMQRLRDYLLLTK